MNLILNGCSPGTKNLGVDALLYATAAGVRARLPEARLTVLGLGPQPGTLELGEGRPAEVVRLDASRRFFSPHTTSNLKLIEKTGLAITPVSRRLAEADAVLDISAGDSFSDIYGPHRFDMICYIKEVAIRRGLPLVLLPQTYGPFASAAARARAARIVSAAEIVWSRDEKSAAVAGELFEEAGGDPSRHRLGVDVAFALPKREATGPDAAAFAAFREKSDAVAGLNVSGLVYNDAAASKASFGLTTDYRAAVDGVVRGLLEAGADVALVPHVLAPRGSAESDADACDAVKASLPEGLRSRVHVVPELDDPREIKWYIGQCDWFCGTRMHSTIAGLSTGVPTVSLAYSMKTAGVFATCGLGDEVFEMRSLPTDEAVAKTVDSWTRRGAIGRTLSERFPDVLAKTDEQMDSIVAACEAVSA